MSAPTPRLWSLVCAIIGHAYRIGAHPAGPEPTGVRTYKAVIE